ncbi:hypothetical protein AWU82_29810 [Pseudomonas glycinae]|uniref:Uncharacterized protein n=1 Tax=Pseudomonas glycinae TaxID=1785145 RepID=A0ABM6QI73_9PSED|nr:hypothetical protein [Pseudomonas glycinae]AUG97610.1 hypothetical protein AWU82_29810 [Pseudomonas glycinae]
MLLLEDAPRVMRLTIWAKNGFKEFLAAVVANKTVIDEVTHRATLQVDSVDRSCRKSRTLRAVLFPSCSSSDGHGIVEAGAPLSVAG